MEEEAQRIAQGQVPEPVPEAVLCKDSTPSSINAIFSPPVNQFDHNNAEPPIYSPFDGEIPHKMDTEDAITPASQHLQMQEEPMEGSQAPHLSTRDSDSDEGIPAPGSNGQAFNPHEAPTPTAEEVDAALAELDSIPDEVCESGDVEEEDEEEEEWSYYRMDLQTQPQGEDVLVTGSSEVMDQNQDKAGVPSSEFSQEQEQKTENRPLMSSQEFMEESPVDYVQTDNPSKSPDLFERITENAAKFNKESSLMETSMSNVGEYLDNYEPSSSPNAPGSPRSVEGFVTSVELNTPEEIGATTLAQETNGSGIEQSSGPFSVYVSSSPEPVSLDPHLQTSGDFGSVSEITNGQVENEMEPSGNISPVEIVHAQSTVEVIASPSPSEKKEMEIPDVQTSPKVPVEDLTFIPEPAVEPTAEKPVPVFIDGGTPVSEGEPEIISDVLAGFTSEPITTDLLSKEPSGEAFIMEQTCSPVLPVPEQTLPALTPDSPLLEQPFVCPGFESSSPQVSVEAEVPTFTEPSFKLSPEPSPAMASLLEEEPTPAPMSPVLEPSSAPLSPVLEPTPAPRSPVLEPSPAPLSPVLEPSPAPLSPVLEPSPAPLSPVLEPSPAPLSPVLEPSPAPLSPVLEPLPVPMSPVMDPSPVPMSPVMDPSPVPMSPTLDPSPAPVSSFVEPSPVVELSPAPMSPFEEPTQAPISPVEDKAQGSMPSIEPSLVPEQPFVLETSLPVSSAVAVVETAASPSVVSEIIESAPGMEPKAVEEVPVSAASEGVNGEKLETKALDTKEDEILINTGTVIIPVIPQEELKETKPEVAKSPAKTTKTPSKATDTAGKSTPSRSTPGKATPRTPSARTPLTKSADKKPAPSSRPTQKPMPTKPTIEKTTTARTKTTPTGSAASKQPITKPSTRPAPRTTSVKPPTTTTTKPTERKTTKPATPTAPRAALSKPSAAASRSAQPIPTTRTTTTAKRPISAPVKKIEKTDTSKVNGTATKPAPRTATSRPATASNVPRKPLSATAKSVPEKETKNTTNRMLSTTTKSAQRPVPGTARSLNSRTAATGLTSLTKTAGKVDGTSTTTTTSKARMTSITKSSATSKATGIAAKKTLVSKTSTTKTKAAAAASSKIQKSEMISAPVANGENKISHEETSVEVIEKCAAEDVIQCSTTEQVISTEAVEVIVNGDH